LEENLERIWTRFYKVDSARTSANGGTGIGLALVKAIMSNYGNSYGVLNKQNGVEFYFEVPMYIMENKEM
jgi:signal transduction histidine kinase